MTEIPLTQGKVALVDDADAAAVLAKRWFAMHTGPRKWYAATKVGRKNVPMHRFLTGYAMTDRKNSDGLDNQRANLRDCSNTQNQYNRRKQKSSSRFKGVCKDTRSPRWISQIQKDGKHYHLGYFDEEEAAAEAYKARATEFFGEFARF